MSVQPPSSTPTQTQSKTNRATVITLVVIAVILAVLDERRLLDWPQTLAGTVTVRRGVNGRGRPLTYYLNYSRDEVSFVPCVSGADVLGSAGAPGAAIDSGAPVTIPAWGVLVVEGDGA